MKILTNYEEVKKLSSNRYVFFDSDFLGEIFKDEDSFAETISLFSSGSILIDPLAEFEFLRDIYVPKERLIREEFIASPIFYPVASHQDLYLKIQENALLLSKIYAHNMPGNKCSTIDLFLAARIMFYLKKAIMVTGNKRHFPSCIFDTLFVLNIEQQDGTMRAYSGVSFNKGKFQGAYKKLMALEKSGKEKLKKVTKNQ